MAPRALAVPAAGGLPQVQDGRLGGLRHRQGGLQRLRAVPPVQGRRRLRRRGRQRPPGLRDHRLLDPDQELSAGVHRHRHAHGRRRAGSEAVGREGPRPQVAAHAGWPSSASRGRSSASATRPRPRSRGSQSRTSSRAGARTYWKCLRRRSSCSGACGSPAE